MLEGAATLLWDRRTAGKTPDLSFIVPCKNEAKYLAQCLESLKRFAPPEKHYEIILVDNGSSDGSVSIAESVGVDVALTHSGRIGHGRNVGARVARAPLLVFVDADVCLTAAWQVRASEQWDLWNDGKKEAVWGSWYAVRQDATWVERAWFHPFRFGQKTHMNGGHLIMRADSFWQIGGFPPHLETGEDYELSQNARTHGLVICNDEKLDAVHLGYPQTFRGFVARELWHGRGDVSSLSSLLRSKTALVSFAAVHASPVGAIASLFGAPGYLAASSLVAIPVLAVALVVRTFGRSTLTAFGQKTLLAVGYILARGLAVYPGLSRLLAHKGTPRN